MKIRLWGLPEENDRVTAAIRQVFTVVEESEDDPPRCGTSPLRRRFLELRLQAPGGRHGYSLTPISGARPVTAFPVRAPAPSSPAACRVSAARWAAACRQALRRSPWRGA